MSKEYDLGKAKGKFDKIYMTPLQAFEELFGGVKFSNKEIDYDQLYEIVETALKALEVLKECFDFEGFDEFIPNGKWFEMPIQQRNEILKELTK